MNDDLAVLFVEELHLHFLREAHNPLILAICLLLRFRLMYDVFFNFLVGYFAELTVTFLLEVL